MAGKGKKTFVAGEVLLAQDVNDYLMDQSVMNFASSAARSSAIPTPTEGMTTYVQDRNQIETFDGAEYRGMSGLQLVKKQTIQTAVSSVVVTDAFSATYEAYKIIITGGVGSTGGANLAVKLGSSTAGYFAALFLVSYATSAGTGAANNNFSEWSFVGNADTSSIKFNMDIVNPFLAKNTSFSSSYATSTNAGSQGGLHAVASSFTDFTITPASGTLTGGTIYVYGYGT
jgi:hypothetical protein